MISVAGELIRILGSFKPLFNASAGVVTLLSGRFLVPANEDLPASLLVVLAVAVGFGLNLVESPTNRAWMMLWLVLGLLLALIIYLVVYYGFDGLPSRPSDATTHRGCSPPVARWTRPSHMAIV